MSGGSVIPNAMEKPLAAYLRGYGPTETYLFYVRDGESTGDWHIESPDVDDMLCGETIEVDDGEVRTRRPSRVCKECDRVASS